MTATSQFTTSTFPLTRHIGERVVFPILKALYFPNGEIHKVVGTGVFVGNRRFATAAHVFEGRGSASDLEGASASIYEAARRR
jgi:hypothetical protein